MHEINSIEIHCDNTYTDQRCELVDTPVEHRHAAKVRPNVSMKRKANEGAILISSKKCDDSEIVPYVPN